MERIRPHPFGLDYRPIQNVEKYMRQSIELVCWVYPPRIRIKHLPSLKNQRNYLSRNSRRF